MEYGELVRAHRSHRIDIVFNMDFDPDAVDSCDFETIYTDRLYLVAARQHRFAKRREGVRVAELSDERMILPEEQAYPGLAQRYEALLAGAVDASRALRYRDIDTLYFRIAQGGCVGLSSGHNYRQFEGRVSFVPLVGVDTSYTVSAQWLKGADEAMVEVARNAASACRDYMKSWSDGVPVV